MILGCRTSRNGSYDTNRNGGRGVNRNGRRGVNRTGGRGVNRTGSYGTIFVDSIGLSVSTRGYASYSVSVFISLLSGKIATSSSNSFVILILVPINADSAGLINKSGIIILLFYYPILNSQNYYHLIFYFYYPYYLSLKIYY